MKKKRRIQKKQRRIRGDDVGGDNHVQEARAFFPVYLASFFFSSTPLDDPCSNLSLENPNLKNRSQNSP